MKHESSALWWHKMVTRWPINGAFVSNMINGNFKLSILIENILTLKNEINILHLLPPPVQANSEYNSWLVARHKNEKEYAVKGIFLTHNPCRSSTIQDDIFRGGIQKDISHVQNELTKFISMLNVIYITDDDYSE